MKKKNYITLLELFQYPIEKSIPLTHKYMTAHFSFLIQALKKWRIKLVLWNPPLVKLFQLSVKLNQDLWTIPNFNWSTFSNFSCILHRHFGLTFYSFLSPRVIQHVWNQNIDNWAFRFYNKFITQSTS
jgi:hypothetical protein